MTSMLSEFTIGENDYVERLRKQMTMSVRLYNFLVFSTLSKKSDRTYPTNRFIRTTDTIMWSYEILSLCGNKFIMRRD